MQRSDPTGSEATPSPEPYEAPVIEDVSDGELPLAASPGENISQITK